MTKVEYASVYAIIATVMIGFMLYIGKNADKKSMLVRRQLYLVLAMNMVYLFSFFTNDEYLLVLIYSIVQFFEVWTLFSVLHFALYYADSDMRITRFITCLAMVLCLGDSFMLAYNAFSQRFFEFSVSLSIKS